jgi:hypothetical protein
MTIHRSLSYLGSLVVGLCMYLQPASILASSDINVEAVLVWGTNAEKPTAKKLRELEPELSKKLGKSPYKWKNYFEVERKSVVSSVNITKRLVMSERCELEVKNLGDERVEVKLIGQGKPVSRHVESLPAGYTVVLSGDDKNDTCWMIVLRQIPLQK